MVSESQTRRELAAAFRWAARYNFHEAIANHFSAAVTENGQRFLVNRNGSHFSQVCASDLVLVDTSHRGGPGELGIDPTAWILHSYIHRHVPRAQAIAQDQGRERAVSHARQLGVQGQDVQHVDAKPLQGAGLLVRLHQPE